MAAPSMPAGAGRTATSRLARGAAALYLRAGAAALVTAACVASAAAGWHSPLRTVVALVFLLVVPGWAVGELLGLASEPLYLLIAAIALSLSLDTCVSLSLLYAHAWSLSLATAVLVALTLAALAGGCARGAWRARRRRPAPRAEHSGAL
jgi:uncharacterized membrane protein